jgi:hypothetical protein
MAFAPAPGLLLALAIAVVPHLLMAMRHGADQALLVQAAGRGLGIFVLSLAATFVWLQVQAGFLQRRGRFFDGLPVVALLLTIVSVLGWL